MLTECYYEICESLTQSLFIKYISITYRHVFCGYFVHCFVEANIFDLQISKIIIFLSLGQNFGHEFSLIVAKTAQSAGAIEYTDCISAEE